MVMPATTATDDSTFQAEAVIATFRLVIDAIEAYVLNDELAPPYQLNRWRNLLLDAEARLERRGRARVDELETALQTIYWAGGEEWEETILNVLTPEQRHAWAEAHGIEL
jgi:hypothetical protein